MVLLVQDQPQPASRPPIAAWAQWWLILLVLCLVLLVAVGVILARHHKRMRAMLERRKQRAPIKDAWAEAGRRAEPATVDIDPDEIEPR